MTPTQRTAALRLADTYRMNDSFWADEVHKFLRELIADVNQSLTTEPDCYGYASRLATGIWEKHYKADSPQWKPLDDTLGVLTQIDNMASGLTRKAEPVQEPVAQIMAEYDGGKHGRCIEPLRGWTKLPIGTVLYAAPPQRKPLTREQIDAVWASLGSFTDRESDYRIFARAVERAHGIGETK